MEEEKKSNYIFFYEVQSWQAKYTVYFTIFLLICLLYDTNVFIYSRAKFSEPNPFYYILIIATSILIVVQLLVLYSWKMITEVRQD